MEKEKNLLMAIYGSKAFMKVKQCLEIGKILFSFVNLEDSKDHIDCYMDAEEFGAILMARISNERLFKAIIEEKAKGDKYPKPVFTSPVGGNATGNNGKPISRFFEITPSSSGNSDVCFVAKSFPATENDKGAFIVEKGSKAISTLYVPCSFNDLRIFAYKWSFLEKDYMSSTYCMKNMKSDYTPVCKDTDGSDNGKACPEKISKDDFSERPEERPAENISPTKPGPTVSLEVKSKLMSVPGKNAKVCVVTFKGKEHKLIFFPDKISDKAMYDKFSSSLSEKIEANKTLSIKAAVKESSDNCLIFCSFANAKTAI